MTPAAEALEKFIDSKIPRNLRGNFERDIGMIRGGWEAALLFIKRTAPKWRREVPDESGLWWWWNQDPDSCPICIHIEWSGGAGHFFASIGQYGWNQPQNVADMGGFWMRCREQHAPNTDELHEMEGRQPVTL